MKKIHFILIGLVVFAAVAFTVNDSSQRVKIYHKGNVIEVAPQAVDAHLAHGDYVFGSSSSQSQGY